MILNKISPPEQSKRSAFCKSPRMTEKKKKVKAEGKSPSSKETEMDKKIVFSTLSPCAQKEAQEQASSQGIAGSLICDCHTLSLPAQLTPAGPMCFLSQCLMGMKSDDIHL